MIKKFLNKRMFRAQKKPLIISGIIGVIAIGGIIAGVYFICVDLYPSHEYIVPGVDPNLDPVPLNQIIKVGVLDDMDHITGDHAWKGAYLAAKEINEGGGILVNGTQYYIGLVSGNTNEVHGVFYKGAIVAQDMIDNHDPHFITGGFIYNSLENYLEVIMEDKILFLSTGTSIGGLCDKVRDNYERYKYIFRVMPMNDAGFIGSIINNTRSLAIHLNTTYGGTGKNKVALLRDEIGEWTNLVCDILKTELPKFNLTVIDIPFPLNPSVEDFETCWSLIKTAEAQITCFLNMYTLNETLRVSVDQQYQLIKPRCLFYSAVDIYPQFSSYWDDTKGACQYEICFQSIHNSSKTNLTMPYFNSFVREYGVEPGYTATGSYDAVYLLKHAVIESQSFNSDTIVKTLEKINTSNPLTGVGGNLSFTPYHDLEIGYPFSYGLYCQYKYIDGTKVVIPSSLNYPDSVATSSLRLPYWGVNGLLTDPPGRPGNFTMNSTAEEPDLDGKFNLTWTVSEGADNYSVYMSDSPIEYISKKFDLLAYQTSTTRLSLLLKKGEYYFRVVAYNETGETMSRDDVYVSIPGPGPFDLHTDEPVDTDGKFNLVWTPSARVKNYSVFRYHKKITSINESLTCLANQTALSPFSITGLPNGRYYFAVAAHNEMGLTLSNWEDVVVQIPPNWPIIFIVSISSVAGVASIGLGWRYFKHKAEKKLERERREPPIVEDMKRQPLEGEKPEDKHK
ncbi:MAG: ABC transporter substrate-binding protein [Candidatus Hodarchaeota archaeon]